MFYSKCKRLTAALLICALMLSQALPALALDFPVQGMMTQGGSLRAAASESGEQIAILPVGDAVYITGESGSWYIVEYDGKAGYVAKSLVGIAASAAANAPSQADASRYATQYRGDQGQLVKDLQSALIELGYLSGSADGKYGAKTAQAVSDFQTKNGLNATGSADAATQGLLFEGTPLNAKGKSQAVTVVPTIDGFPVSRGKTGELVVRIQSALTVMDYYSGQVDGKYGSTTFSAVKNFQSKNGLTITGVADEQTQALLFSRTALSAKATQTPIPAATPMPPVIGWENGDKGAEGTFPFTAVTLESVNLRKKASTSSTRLLTVPKGATLTVSAIKGDFLEVSYQKGSKVYNGYVMSQFVDVPAVYFGGKELAADEAAQKKYTSLSSGASGTGVSALQEALKELGFYSAAVTGVYDNATVLAVKAFQSKNDLLQTGFASAELQKLIYEGRPLNAKGKTTNVSVLPPVDDVTMRAGDTGYQVTELQQSLQKLGYYTSAVTGVYDNATVSAVKAFQKKNNLTVDGTAGAKLQEALDILLVPTPVPVLPVEAATAVPAITADNIVTLRRGTRGVAVTRLQERLVALGYYSITPDGIYDSDDIEAVRQFQKKNGLTADGVAGLKTQTLLYSAEALGALATPAPAATAVPATEIRANTDTTLRIGDSGTDVNLLQARLTTLNYFKDTIDGRYGTKTAEAVAAFQKANGLDADGVAGPKTLKAVYKDSAKAAATPAPAASGSASGTAAQPAISSSTVLKIGDTGTNVRSLQNMLITLGYLTGAADGIFGTKTSLAVQAFQKANKLTVDGVAGGETLSRLQTASARKNAQTGTSQTGTAVSSSSAVQTSTVFKAPSASEVRFADWYNEIRAQVKLMPDAIIYDYTTGLYYNVHMFSFGKHCDAEPVTASDTSTMYNIMGIDNWTAHAVWVILSDGKVYMASTHSHGHEVDNNSGNNLEGHICIHFPREMTAEEKESMPYAVSHQNEILRGWEETQSLIR